MIAGRRLARALTAAALALSLFGPGASASDAYFTSEDVERIGSIALDGGSAGARIVGSRMYVVTWNGLQIFDISKPEEPRELGSLDLRLDPLHFGPEDVDTNGKVLILRGPLDRAGTLYVIDVSDASKPELVNEIPNAANHTMTCISECSYAYGSEGVIVDLSPMSSAHVVGDWTSSKGAAVGGHDLTEVRPGIVVTASNPMLLLDARRDPVHPGVISMADVPAGVLTGRTVHGVEWPQKGRDRFVLVGTEKDSPGTCEELQRGELLTFDAPSWGRGGGAKVIDEYRVKTGPWIDGRAPANTACGHWFDPHPDFANGGLMAMAWYEHGVRFVNVTSEGQIEETGYFVPVDGSTSAAYWITDEIVYATDYNLRGIDILRVTGKN